MLRWTLNRWGSWGSRGARAALVAGLLASGSAVAPAGAGAQNPIQAENAMPGTSDWLVREPRQHAIAGYVDDVSYAPGATVSLFVDSEGAPFTYEIYRMGHYGGAGGRLVGRAAGSVPNARQPAPTVRDDRTNGAKLLLTGWHESARFSIPRNWVTGFYLVKLTRTDTGARSYACFVVRAPRPAELVVVLPTTTWQAYNDWGGLSLYRDLRRLPRGIRRTRAHKVSFLRPYRWNHGAGFFFSRERPLVDWLESRGYPVSYATDRDALYRRLVGARTKLVILSGHPEYHSAGERDYYRGLGRRGVSLSIFGGNSFVTQARFSRDGQIVTVWRDRWLDPVKGARATARWELVGWNQNALTGTMDGAGDMGPVTAATTNHWAWAGAGVAAGAVVGLVQGNEQDGVVKNGSTPRKLVVLARARAKGNRRRIASITIIPGPRRTFVFNGSQSSFTFNFGYPGYPGVDPASWVGHHYPASSQDNPTIRRLAGNVIARATGVPNREPVRAPRRRVLAPLTFLSPGRNQLVPVRRPNVVVWAGAPRRTARVRIALDGRRVATVSPRRSTWTGPAFRSLGAHTLRLTAVSSAGRVLSSRAQIVYGVSPRHRIFTVPSRSGDLWRAWA